MQFLLDNVSAVIVLGIVALTVSLVQQRGQQASIEAVVHDMVKARAQAFAEVLEHDLQNMGTGSDPAEEDTENAAYFTCEGAHDGTRTTRFRFSTTENPKASSPTPIEVTYRLDPALTPGGQPRTVRIGGVERAVYEMERRVGGTATGRSGAILAQFQIEVATDDDPRFQPVDGNCPGSDPAGSAVRAVRVSFVAAVAPIERDASDKANTSATNVARYGVTLHPPNMARF